MRWILFFLFFCRLAQWINNKIKKKTIENWIEIKHWMSWHTFYIPKDIKFNSIEIHKKTKRQGKFIFIHFHFIIIDKKNQTKKNIYIYLYIIKIQWQNIQDETVPNPWKLSNKVFWSTFPINIYILLQIFVWKLFSSAIFHRFLAELEFLKKIV